MEIRRIRISEYYLNAGEFRTPLFDYYIQMYSDNIIILGAFDNRSNIIGILLALDDEDLCFVVNVKYLNCQNLDIFITGLHNKLIQNCKADTIEWILDSKDPIINTINKLGWRKYFDRHIFTISIHEKSIIAISSLIVKSCEKSFKSLAKEGYQIISLDDYDGNIQKDILSVTDNNKFKYVESILNSAKGPIDSNYSLVMVKEGRIISYLLNTRRDDSNLETAFIYTPLHNRGNGYAKLLTIHMMNSLPSSNYKAIRFYVNEDNVSSMNLVKKYLRKLVRTNKQLVYRYNK